MKDGLQMAPYGGLDCSWAPKSDNTGFESQTRHVLGMLAWAIIFKASFAHHSNGNNAYITAFLHGLKGIMYGKYSVRLA